MPGGREARWKVVSQIQAVTMEAAYEPLDSRNGQQLMMNWIFEEGSYEQRGEGTQVSLKSPAQ